jgi:hypothetical protein
MSVDSSDHPLVATLADSSAAMSEDWLVRQLVAMSGD